MTTSRIDVTLSDLKATEKLGMVLASSLESGGVILLEGALGAGKTTLVQAICRHLGVMDCVTSPTYDLLHTYHSSHMTVHHVDGYRLTDPREWDVLDLPWPVTPQVVVLAEWGAVLREQYPDRLELCLASRGIETDREVELQAFGRDWCLRLNDIAKELQRGL